MSRKPMSVTKASMTESLLPKRFFEFTIDQFPGARIHLERAARYALRFNRQPDPAPLLILGPEDTGKSFLAFHVGRIFLAHGYSVLYATGDSLTDDYLKFVRDSPSDFPRHVLRTDLLIVDDVAAPLNPSMKTALERMVKSRENERKPYVLVSEFTSPNEFEVAYSKGLSNSIFESAVVVNTCGRHRSVKDMARKLEMLQDEN